MCIIRCWPDFQLFRVLRRVLAILVDFPIYPVRWWSVGRPFDWDRLRVYTAVEVCTGLSEDVWYHTGCSCFFLFRDGPSGLFTSISPILYSWSTQLVAVNPQAYVEVARSTFAHVKHKYQVQVFLQYEKCLELQCKPITHKKPARITCHSNCTVLYSSEQHSVVSTLAPVTGCNSLAYILYQQYNVYRQHSYSLLWFLTSSVRVKSLIHSANQNGAILPNTLQVLRTDQEEAVGKRDHRTQ